MSAQIVDVHGMMNKHRQTMHTMKVICNVLFSETYISSCPYSANSSTKTNYNITVNLAQRPDI